MATKQQTTRKRTRTKSSKRTNTDEREVRLDFVNVDMEFEGKVVFRPRGVNLFIDLMDANGACKTLHTANGSNDKLYTNIQDYDPQYAGRALKLEL